MQEDPYAVHDAHHYGRVNAGVINTADPVARYCHADYTVQVHGQATRPIKSVVLSSLSQLSSAR